MKNETFGSRFRALRNEKKLTQEKIAELFYLNTSSISKYEKDRSIPETNLLIQFADFFDVSVDYLLCRTNVPFKMTETKHGMILTDKQERITLTAAKQKALEQYLALPENQQAEIDSFIAFKSFKD